MRPSRPLRAFVRPRWRRSVACLLLVAHLAASAGIAIPAPAAAAQDRSTPYPCMDRLCGCRSAKECWQSCCCFTKGQRRAWFERRGIDVGSLEDAPRPDVSDGEPGCCREDSEPDTPCPCRESNEPEVPPAKAAKP